MMECECEDLATEHRADNIEAVKLFAVEDYIENFRGSCDADGFAWRDGTCPSSALSGKAMTYGWSILSAGW